MVDEMVVEDVAVAETKAVEAGLLGETLDML